MFDLKKYLWKMRFTKIQCSFHFGISQPTLRLIGKGKPVSRKIAERVAKVAGCSAYSLMRPRTGGGDDRP